MFPGPKSQTRNLPACRICHKGCLAHYPKHWQKTTYQRYPKAGLLCDTRTHFILAVVPERGPSSDIKHLQRALRQAQRRVRIDSLPADRLLETTSASATPSHALLAALASRNRQQYAKATARIGAACPNLLESVR